MRLRTIIRIARWEVLKGTGGVDRGVLTVLATAVVFGLAVLLVTVSGGIVMEDGLYRVGVYDSDPVVEPLDEASEFSVSDVDPSILSDGTLRSDSYDVVIIEDRFYPNIVDGSPTEKSLAAIAAMRDAIDRYNDRQMAVEPNQTAAFPVNVSIEYASREHHGDVLAQQPTGDDQPPETPRPTQTTPTPSSTDSSGDDSVYESSASPSPTPDQDVMMVESNESTSVDYHDHEMHGNRTLSNTPSNITPPFPFQSLILAFVFLLPLNFVVQVYGSSMLSERIGRRGELLLVAPIQPTEIVVGKSIPYLVSSIAITGVIVGVLQLGDATAGIVSILAIIPLALLFLGATFLGSMYVRSFKELTFVSVTISVLLTTFAFVPAIFAETSPVAFISPLTLVVQELGQTPITVGQFLFATIPATLLAIVCYVLGLSLYREEDLFTQRPVHLKILDSLAGYIYRPLHVGVVVAMLVPFVFVVELLLVALLVVAPLTISLPLIFGFVAIIEELAKGIPIYAGYSHNRLRPTRRVALVAGVASGVGFFLAEKIALIVQIVGLPELVLADAVFQTGFGSGELILVAILALAPLFLHCVTATISAEGARRNRRWFIGCLVVAMLIHFVYNVLVVTYFV